MEDSKRLKAFHKARELLVNAGIDSVLLEHAFEHASILDVGADSKHHQTVGYMQCLSDLFHLDAFAKPETSKGIVTDFGATEKLVAEGRLTPEEAHELLRGEG